MARHCLFYAIQYDDHDDQTDGAGWYTGASGPFRATRPDAIKRYEKAAVEAPSNFSVRLIECRVLEQKDGHPSDPE